MSSFDKTGAAKDSGVKIWAAGATTIGCEVGTGKTGFFGFFCFTTFPASPLLNLKDEDFEVSSLVAFAAGATNCWAAAVFATSDLSPVGVFSR